MPTTVYAPTAVYATRERRAISDRTVALLFAVVPIVIFAFAVAYFGFGSAIELATAYSG